MQSLTISVCSHGGANFTSISDALRSAGNGDTIVLKAGQYDERVVLEKPVTIRGENPADRKSVIIAGGFVSVSERGEIADVMVQQGIDIRSGVCKVENCEVEFGDGIKVGQNAQAAIVRCRVAGANQLGDGIYFQEGARGQVTECEIVNHRVNGIHLKAAEVEITKNVIRGCRFGIYYRRGAKGTCEGNTISDMSNHGVYSVQESAPNVTNNELSNCAVQAICVAQGSAGTFRGNVVRGNVHVHQGTTAQCTDNNISGFYDNELIGLSTSAGGSGLPTAAGGGAASPAASVSHRP